MNTCLEPVLEISVDIYDNPMLQLSVFIIEKSFSTKRKIYVFPFSFTEETIFYYARLNAREFLIISSSSWVNALRSHDVISLGESLDTIAVLSRFLRMSGSNNSPVVDCHKLKPVQSFQMRKG